ncbi:aspartate-semialdehyde dehydrogenase [Candidatus Enterovibrio escicola]|uniref:Aspartate-semialdehyde dehydrogenase n=1 Tax=Candidatus Enterovibrio escicola TaxID=1927127 RepID=A0A2A5T2S4_9GAMM|nr:aspartate-semialdehyde dehydrogenase [Candidatus Enterovibrio escacola]PCS22430.1 Aspartate-semialdehyde dehydrogenase [Candidatus Enterovibrio escacola]
MTKKFNAGFDVAVLGATGIVGRTIVEVLEERKFPVCNLYLLANEYNAGETFRFNGKSVCVKNVEDFDWSQVQVGLFTAGAEVSGRWAQIAVEEGVIVIDDSSRFRYDPDIPLVITEVNPEVIADFRNRNIIAIPNCLTIQMMVALKPIYDLVGIERINVATYQSVSGSGKKGIDELACQTVKLLSGQDVETNTYKKQIAFNCLPHIDKLMNNGYTKEEMKMVWETQKILGNENIAINPTCVRVPVFHGYAEAVHIECRQPLDAIEAIDLLSRAKGVEVFANEDYPTQVINGVGKDNVMIGRVRKDISHPNGLNLWIVADNIRKGAATNSVQIAEILVRNYL